MYLVNNKTVFSLNYLQSNSLTSVQQNHLFESEDGCYVFSEQQSRIFPKLFTIKFINKCPTKPSIY